MNWPSVWFADAVDAVPLPIIIAAESSGNAVFSRRFPPDQPIVDTPSQAIIQN
jgi:hypothetical protein